MKGYLAKSLKISFIYSLKIWTLSNCSIYFETLYMHWIHMYRAHKSDVQRSGWAGTWHLEFLRYKHEGSENFSPPPKKCVHVALSATPASKRGSKIGQDRSCSHTSYSRWTKGNSNIPLPQLHRDRGQKRGEGLYICFSSSNHSEEAKLLHLRNTTRQTSCNSCIVQPSQ